jgi:5'-nucleotidase
VDLSGYDWTWSVRGAVSLAQLVLGEGLPTRSVVNLNAPGTGVARGVETTRLGRRSWRRGGLDLEHTDSHGHGYYSFEVNSDNDPQFVPDPGTDFAALQRGQISLTPMSLAWGDNAAAAELQNWVEKAATAMTADLGLEGTTP